MNEIKVIREKMKECAQNGDYEAAHSNADKLLCELIRLLTKRASEEHKQEIASILEAYDNVGKWYA